MYVISLHGLPILTDDAHSTKCLERRVSESRRRTKCFAKTHLEDLYYYYLVWVIKVNLVSLRDHLGNLVYDLETL
jgi:hypothetical protein